MTIVAERRVRVSIVAGIVVGGLVTGVLVAGGTREESGSGSTSTTQPEARETSCAGTLLAHWNGRTESLSSCAGMIGLAPSDVEVRLAVGQEVTVVSPPVAMMKSGGGTVVLPTPPTVTNLHTTDTRVLIPTSTSSRGATFRAVSQGVADVVGDSRSCFAPNGELADSCAVMHVVVS